MKTSKMVIAALFNGGLVAAHTYEMKEYLQDLVYANTNNFETMDTQLTIPMKVGGSTLNVVLDTGSAMTWIADTHCKTCSKAHYNS